MDAKEFPCSLYASASLIDNKITGWKVSDHPLVWGSSDYGGGEIVTKEFKVSSWDEWNEVFNEDAPEWFSQWELCAGYTGFKPYGVKGGGEE